MYTILVNVDRVTSCLAELPDISWLGSKKKQWQAPSSLSKKGKGARNQSSAKHGYNSRSHGSLGGM